MYVIFISTSDFGGSNMAGLSDVTTAQLRYFVEAADKLSMTRAAETLMVAQSAVSSSVAQLERAIGVQLFIRKPAKGLILTAAGERLQHEARAVLTGLEDAIESARGQVGEVSGAVTLACFVTLVPFYVPGLLAQLSDRYPDLKVEVLETDSEGMVEALSTGRAQLGLGYPFGLGPSIRTLEVTTTRPYVLVSESHRLSRSKSINLDRLKGEEMILLDLPYSRDYFLDTLRTAGVEPAVRYWTGNYETVRSLVAQGHGFSILNQLPASSVTYSGQSVVPIAIRDDVPGLPVIIASLEGVRPTARSRAVAAGILSMASMHNELRE
jgi:DNA-binding transcriptional LysR family regulator